MKRKILFIIAVLFVTVMMLSGNYLRVKTPSILDSIHKSASVTP